MGYLGEVSGINVASKTSPYQRAFSRGTPAKSARKDDVLDLVEAKFDSYDRDQNGRITWSEMRKNIADPSFKGKHAAALATLYSVVNDTAGERDLVRKPSVTHEFLVELRDDRDFAREEGEDFSADVYYQKYLGKLENASTELFAGGLPNAFQVAQGYGPSCAVLASTTAQARINPHVIKDAISTREDGKIEVKFPGRSKPVIVTPTTDTETALFASAGQNGTWLTTVEKAWGATQTTQPLAAFEQSSWPTKSIRAWSGGDTTTSTVPKNLLNYKVGEVPDFMKETAKALSGNRMVVAWTRNGEPSLKNLVPGHAHTMTGFDSDNGTVELRNPWGHREPLDENGQVRDGRDDGVFELSLAEFAKDFIRIAYHTV